MACFSKVILESIETFRLLRPGIGIDNVMVGIALAVAQPIGFWVLVIYAIAIIFARASG